MADKSNDKAIHEQALIEFNAIRSAVKDERQQCLNDRRFYSIAGAQWEGALGAHYENKPKIEVNKIHLSVIRIFNEYRNNRITVDYIPKDGSQNSELAEACNGLYRADEQDSCASEAYDNAFEEGVGGGFGAWRLRAEYEDEYDDDDDRQRIRIEPIYDADTCVYFDLNAKRQDKSDAKHCFVLTSMTPDAYKDEYDDDPASWPKDISDTSQFNWSTPDAVYVAEYYRVEEKSEKIFTYKNNLIDGMEEKRFTETDMDDDDWAETAAQLKATGYRKTGGKTVKRRKVHKYIMSGGSILEDMGFIAGMHIPIVPFYGKRWFVDNIERCMGQVRLAKDAQRLKNMQLSRLAEISALTPLEKPIFVPEQIAGHENMWREDNLKNQPYLLVNKIFDKDGQEALAGPVGYTKPPQVPQAMAALLQITEQDMLDILGKQEEGEKIQPNTSGKAIELVQNQLGMQSFIFMDNMANAIRRGGEIWLSMAKEIYIEDGRKMKAVKSGGEVEQVELGKTALNEQSGEIEREIDLSNAKLDVAVDVGPSSASKRQATVRALIGMMQMTADPETQMVLLAMAMMNMEGEGISDARKYFRGKLIRAGVTEPTEQEAMELAKEMQQMQEQPDPNAELLLAEAEKSKAQAVKAQADTEYTAARAEETRAKTMETLSNIESEQRQAVIDAAKGIQDVFQQAAQIPEPVPGE